MSENLQNQIILLFDVIENWARGDLRERIAIFYNDDLVVASNDLIDHFNIFVKTLNQFIDNLNKELKKLPLTSSLGEMYRID